MLWHKILLVANHSLLQKKHYGSVRFAEKISRNIVPANLLWEKNIVPGEKISWKRRIIREANRAIGLGAKLGAKIYGANVPAKSPPRLRRARDLGAKIYGAETCKLGATNDGAELRVQILKSYL